MYQWKLDRFIRFITATAQSAPLHGEILEVLHRKLGTFWRINIILNWSFFKCCFELLMDIYLFVLIKLSLIEKVGLACFALQADTSMLKYCIIVDYFVEAWTSDIHVGCCSTSRKRLACMLLSWRLRFAIRPKAFLQTPQIYITPVQLKS